MDELPTVMPSRRPGILVADYDTELVVLVPDNRQTHHLDVGMSVVLDACDGTTPVADVVEEIATATAAQHGDVSSWLLDVLGQLEELGII